MGKKHATIRLPIPPDLPPSLVASVLQDLSALIACHPCVAAHELRNGGAETTSAAAATPAPPPSSHGHSGSKRSSILSRYKRGKAATDRNTTSGNGSGSGNGSSDKTPNSPRPPPRSAESHSTNGSEDEEVGDLEYDIWEEVWVIPGLRAAQRRYRASGRAVRGGARFCVHGDRGGGGGWGSGSFWAPGPPVALRARAAVVRRGGEPPGIRDEAWAESPEDFDAPITMSVEGGDGDDGGVNGGGSGETEWDLVARYELEMPRLVMPFAAGSMMDSQRAMYEQALCHARWRRTLC